MRRGILCIETENWNFSESISDSHHHRNS